MKNIEFTVLPPQKDIGDGFIVRRSLPNIKRRSVGPFIFWDHMGPAKIFGDKELKVRAHPHIGLATITYLLSGEIMHRDSLNNEQAIRPREVNWMTAGKGIVHSERSTSFDKEMILEGIQLWLALPVEFEDVDPSFFHCKESDLPLLNFEGLEMQLIAGEFLGKKSPVPVFSNLFYLSGRSAEVTPFSYELDPNIEAAVYVVRGQLTINRKSYGPTAMVGFQSGTKIEFETSDDAEFFLFGGEALAEERFLWWNFVSSSKEKIERAKIKWINGELGKVINESESIPLPDR